MILEREQESGRRHKFRSGRGQLDRDLRWASV